MQAIALTRASELIHVTDTLDQLGVSAERLLEQANLPFWHYSDPDDLIPKHHIFELMDRAARSLDISDFGFLVGARTSLSSLGSFGRLVAGSITTRSALMTSCRLVPLHNAGSRLSLVEAGEETWFCHSESQSPRTGRRQKEQYALMRMIDNVRIGAGPSWRPAKVCLQTQKAPGRAMREALGDPEIHIGQEVTAFPVPRAQLALPPRRNGTSGEAGHAEEARLRQTAPASGFVDSLRQLAQTLLKQDGVPRIETMAEITGLSVRTLQRRLANHGLSHFEIVDQARHRAATRLLRDSAIRITDVAMDLGYADSAHFTRAFKRWAGVTPSEYRGHQMAM